MISIGARSIPEAGNRTPFYSEPVTGRLSVRAGPGLNLYGRRGDGVESQSSAIWYEGF
jgi:hypothetical protein